MAETRRQLRESSLVLHPVERTGGAERPGGEDDLAGGERSLFSPDSGPRSFGVDPIAASRAGNDVHRLVFRMDDRPVALGEEGS